MTEAHGVEITDVPPGDRPSLEWILEESFEGLYLWHSKNTLREVERVRVAKERDVSIGLLMMKTIDPGVGYIFYVAVARAQRGKGISRLLVDDSLRIFREAGVTEVFASVENDNLPSGKLFEGEGFAKTGLAELSKERGTLRALNMYRLMVVVPGEILLRKLLK